MYFLVAFQEKYLTFLVKIPPTYEHLFYNKFVRLYVTDIFATYIHTDPSLFLSNVDKLREIWVSRSFGI